MLIEKRAIGPLMGFPALFGRQRFPGRIQESRNGFQRICAETNDPGVFRGREERMKGRTEKMGEEIRVLFWSREEKFTDAINCFCLDLDKEFGPFVCWFQNILYRDRPFWWGVPLIWAIHENTSSLDHPWLAHQIGVDGRFRWLVHYLKKKKKKKKMWIQW